MYRIRNILSVGQEMSGENESFAIEITQEIMMKGPLSLNRRESLHKSQQTFVDNNYPLIKEKVIYE